MDTGVRVLIWLLPLEVLPRVMGMISGADTAPAAMATDHWKLSGGAGIRTASVRRYRTLCEVPRVVSLLLLSLSGPSPWKLAPPTAPLVLSASARLTPAEIRRIYRDTQTGL